MTPRRGSDGRLHAGILYYSGEEASEVVGRAVERGYAVAIHAFGNEAVDQALSALAKVRKTHPDAPPPRIEHAAILDDALIVRAADLGVQIVTQPAFLQPFGAAPAPEPVGLRLLPLRSLADRGVHVASSSDGPMAYDPLLALRAAVTRQATPRRRIHADEAISPEAWLRMATLEGARAAASLDVAGSIEPGKRADLVVLNQSPLEPEKLDGLRVDATLLAGELVYGTL
jgi:predicted amidohydrolase YtcJ